MTETTYPEPNAPSETTRFRLAYEAMLPAIDAVPESELMPITLDIPSTTATVLGALPAIRTLRAELADLPQTNASLVDKLEPYALALFEAHSSYLDASRPPAPVAELVAAATEARDRLYPDALALANRGLFDQETLAGYRGTPGYKILVVDLNLLCRGFRRRWPDIEGKTPVTLEEIDRAEMIGEQLMTAIGEREQAPAGAAAAALRRQRAFTLLTKSYDAIRRGVLYLRHDQGDADKIAPSLYAGRGGGRRRDEDATEGEGGADDLASFDDPPTVSLPLPRTNVTTEKAVSAGMPGASPFVRD